MAEGAHVPHCLGIHTNWRVSISKFSLCGRVAANKTSLYFDRGSVAAENVIIS